MKENATELMTLRVIDYDDGQAVIVLAAKKAADLLSKLVIEINSGEFDDFTNARIEIVGDDRKSDTAHCDKLVAAYEAQIASSWQAGGAE